MSKTEHINLFNIVICGEAWFSTLPAEYQQILKDDFFSCAYDSAQEVIAAQADLEKQLVDNGMTIVEVDLDAFKEAAKSAYEKLGWTDLREQMYRYRLEYIKDADKHPILLIEHENIFRAVKARHVAEAKAAMRGHIDNQEITVSQNIKQKEESN